MNELKLMGSKSSAKSFLAHGSPGGFALPFLLSAVLATSGCAGFRACDQSEPWWGIDKAKHFTAGAAVGAGTMMVTDEEMNSGEAAAISMATVMSIGAAKEWYDIKVKKTCWSWKDMAWDFLGASVGISIATSANE